jgi:hypothetical protein
LILNENTSIYTKEKIDREAYDELSLHPGKSVDKVFDGYRTLKNTLEEKNVFSLDRKKAFKPKSPQDKLILIPVNFPKTYRRSSFGIGLGDNEIKTRYNISLISLYISCFVSDVFVFIC